MTDTPEVHQVIVAIRPVSRAEPTGYNSRGYFIVSDGVVTMTDLKGIPAADDTGKVYSHKLEPGENANQVAGELTVKLRKALRGKNAPKAGFGGPLHYPKLGIA